MLGLTSNYVQLALLVVHRCRSYTAKAVSEVDTFGGITCSIISCLVVLQKNSIVTKFCHLAFQVPLIMPYHVVN